MGGDARGKRRDRTKRRERRREMKAKRDTERINLRGKFQVLIHWEGRGTLPIPRGMLWEKLPPANPEK